MSLWSYKTSNGPSKKLWRYLAVYSTSSTKTQRLSWKKKENHITIVLHFAGLTRHLLILIPIFLDYLRSIRTWFNTYCVSPTYFRPIGMRFKFCFDSPTIGTIFRNMKMRFDCSHVSLNFFYYFCKTIVVKD